MSLSGSLEQSFTLFIALNVYSMFTNAFTNIYHCSRKLWFLIYFFYCIICLTHTRLLSNDTFTTVSSSWGGYVANAITTILHCFTSRSFTLYMINLDSFYNRTQGVGPGRQFYSANPDTPLAFPLIGLEESDPRRWYLSAFYSANQVVPLALLLLA